MMYPFLTLDDQTEIVHSEMKPDGRVKVYVEKPDEKDFFHNAVCWLPGYQWEDINGFTPEEIAKVIKPQFKETDEATLETIISRYYSQDTWKTDLILQQDSFTLLEDILIDAGQLSDYVNYEDLVTTKFAEEAKK